MRPIITLLALLLATAQELSALGAAARSQSAGDEPSTEEVLRTMRRATEYMMDEVSADGGFVWNYLPDFSRQWGELEARRSMVWLQSPSTPDMGQLLLDAYHATHDEYYYECARKVALCIVRGQHESGGWNYMFDLDGTDSLRAWYATIGRQAWRLEEFQHYYGNATFDDEATKHCAELLLRLYQEKRDADLLVPLRKAISFFLESQYANGGWPQRYPLMYDHPFRGKADYSSFVTLNDNVMAENIDFLIQCYTQLGLDFLIHPIERAMHLLRDLQQPPPLAGWADQYTPDDLRPAHARSYEPRSVNTGTTVGMFFLMIDYYRLTGDPSYLRRLPEAITFLEKRALPHELAAKVRRTPLQDDEILVPRFIDPYTRRPLYVHRRGSNVGNGAYYTDEQAEGTIAHYSSFMTVSPARLREALAQAHAFDPAQLKAHSPFSHCGSMPAEKFHYKRGIRQRPGQQPPSVRAIVASLDEKGRWLVPLRQVSHPYKPMPADMDESHDTAYGQTMVGDDYDTSPYENRDVKGISTQAYIQNMVVLMQSLKTTE